MYTVSRSCEASFCLIGGIGTLGISLTGSEKQTIKVFHNSAFLQSILIFIKAIPNIS
jgi:hypothetical protein